MSKIPVSDNKFEVLAHEFENEAYPPDIDVNCFVDDELTIGFTADSPHVATQALKNLQSARQFSFKVNQVTVEQLEQLIAEFVNNDVQALTTHEDVLGAIQTQPTYLWDIFNWPDDKRTALFQQHAVYRAISTCPYQEDEPLDYLPRVRARLEETDSANLLELVTRLYPDDDSRNVALHLAICDLFFMVAAPSVYFDPLKIQCLMPDTIGPARLVSSPFLLWSDKIHLCLTKSEVSLAFLNDERTPDIVRTSLNAIQAIPVPREPTSARVVNPQL